MNLLLISGLCIITISIIANVLTRLSLKKKSNELAVRIRAIKTGKEAFIDIETDVKNNFNKHIISHSEEKQFTDYYSDIFHDADSLLKRLDKFHINPPAIIAKFTHDFKCIHSIIIRHNEDVIKYTLDTYKNFFDHCLKYPLDKQQRRSIISEEDNCLVVSSAGSGKTSSIIGKVKYLIDIKHVNPQNILLISYTNKAAAELTERMGAADLKGYTFHKLALELIGKTTGKKPSICDNPNALFVEIYHILLNNKNFKRSIVKYLIDYQEPESEKTKNEQMQQLSDLKKNRLKALFPDMDGKAIYVRSKQEQKICFILSSLGIKFKYEEPYEYPLADETHSQYKPDFSIYYEQDNKIHRIYLEHFGVDEHGLVPVWFAKDRGISYEEANRKYNDGITWKKDAHKKFGTKLLVTSSADFNNSDIHTKLKKLLQESNVPIHEKSDNELYDMILPPGSKQEKAFIGLIVTFVTLTKSSGKSIYDVLKQTKNTKDGRSTFIIKNIFLPVYERYIEELKNRNQIDFTDAILQATEICRSSHPLKYDYIIVDEFQDISIDRYNFLKSLRETEPPAKLYCVGDDWQSIYRFSGSDMALFNQFPDYFGATEINKIETTYRFGEPLISLSSKFIQQNKIQIQKNIHSFNSKFKTELEFLAYERNNYCNFIGNLIASIPPDKSVFLLGRYSFDDYYLSLKYKSIKEGARFFYLIENRKIEFMTIHKSKGLEADYVIILQCNKDTLGFPSMINDDPILNYVLTKSDQYPYGEERRLFYVAITRAKIKTYILYDSKSPSVFINEFLHPEQIPENSYTKHPNANKKWTSSADKFLMNLYHEGKSIKYIAEKMGRSYTSIIMRIGKLEGKK